MMLIFILSSIPVELENIEDKRGILYRNPEIQNMLHLPVFAVLSSLWIVAYRQRESSIKKSVLCALSITIFYGFVDEYHQYYVPGRFMSLTDICFDVVGSSLGGVAYYGIQEVKSRR